MIMKIHPFFSSFFLIIICAHTLVAKDLYAFWDDQILVSRDIVQERQTDRKYAIPTAAIDEAIGIVIIERFKAGFIFGFSRGYAVVMAKDSTGQWSPPAFYNAGSGSFGLQMGIEQRNLILLIMNEEGMDQIRKQGEVGLSGDITAAIGPTGLMTDVVKIPKSDVLVYTHGEAYSVGLSMSLWGIRFNNTANQSYYRKRSLTSDDILFKRKVQMPESAKKLINALR